MFKQCPVFDSGLELQDSKIQEICCKADRLDIMEKYVALQALKEQEARGEYLTPDDQEINRKWKILIYTIFLMALFYFLSGCRWDSL